jgi:hypothetical protein
LSDVPEDRLWLFSERSAIQGTHRLARTKVVDRRHLVCRSEGQLTALLHATGQPQPWQPAARRDLRRTAYVICLRELLTRPDAPRQARAGRVLRSIKRQLPVKRGSR